MVIFLQVTKVHKENEKWPRIQTTYDAKCLKASPSTSEQFAKVPLGDFSSQGEFLGFPNGLNTYPR